MNRRETYERLKHKSEYVRFDDLCHAAEGFGFFWEGATGQCTWRREIPGDKRPGAPLGDPYGEMFRMSR